MNVIEYIKKYGNTSFEDKPLNDADKLLFGLLSYVYYNGAAPKCEKEKKTIKEVAEIFFESNTRESLKKNILAIRGSIKLLKLIQNKKRYQALYMYNDTYIGDDSQQFSAICIEITPSLVYVSFEGTDQRISGWEEDAKMAYMFPVKAQKHAIRYLNKHFTFKKCSIIVGGHSKGGNLSLVASMYCNQLVRNKIVEIYSFDGPGLTKKMIDSNRYKRIENRFYHVVPHNSVVGMLMRNGNNDIVIKTTGTGILGHYAEKWQFEDYKFKRVKLSRSSRIVYNGIQTWVDKYSKKEFKLFTQQVFSLFKKENVTSLLEIFEHPKILINIYKNTHDLDPIVSNMVKDLIDILVDYSKEAFTSIFKR